MDKLTNKNSGLCVIHGPVRERVRDGAAILGRLIPEVLEIMLGNHDADWGEIRYSVIDLGSS